MARLRRLLWIAVVAAYVDDDDRACEDDRPKVCDRRYRCHAFLSTAAQMCSGVEEYRAACDRATRRKDVLNVISAVELRFEECL